MTGDLTDKARGALLAALLVLSVVSIGAAPAAAQTQDATLSIGDAEASPGDTVEVTLALSDATDVASYSANITFDESVVQVQSISGVDFPDPTANTNNDEGWTSMTAAVSPTSPVDNPEFATITFEVVGTAGESTTLGFNEAGTSVSDADGNTIPLTFDSGSVAVPESATVTFNDQTAVGGDQVTVDSAYLPDGGYVAVEDADGNELGWSDELSAGTSDNIDVSLSPAISEDQSLSAVAYQSDGETPYETPDGQTVSDSADVSYLDADRMFDSVDALENSLVYSGQSVAVDVSGQGLDDGDEVQLRKVTGDDSSTTSALLTVENQMVQFETDDLETDDYFLLGGNIDRTNSEFEVVTQDLNVEFADAEVDNAGSTTNELTIGSSLRNDYDVTIYVANFTESDYEDVFAAGDVYENDDGDYVIDIENAEGTHELDFAGIDADDYEFEVDVTDATASDTAEVSVIDVGEGELDLGDVTVEEEQGDLASITVEFSGAATSGTLLIGDANNDGYQANVSVEDAGDGEVTVYFNTYKAGADASDVSADQIVWADTGDEDDAATLTNLDSDEQQLSDILDTGNYELAVSTSDVADTEEQPDAVGTLFVQERSTDAINLWTASSSNAGNLEEVSDITGAVDEGTLTEADTFAKGDAMVAEISATGLTGMLPADEEDVTTAFQTSLENDDSTEAFDLMAEQLNPGSNTDPNEVNFADVEPTVLYDSDSNNYYVIVTSTDDVASVLSGGDGELADGDEYELTFDLKDQRLLDYSDSATPSDEYESLSTELAVEDRTADFDVEEVDDNEYIVVEAAEDQAISGTTNIAPGTELRIRAQGDGDARFVKEQTEIVVQNDGTFSATFDFSDRAVDEEFTATLRGHGMSENPSASGLISEAVEETTTEPTTTEPTTTEPTTTEPTTTEPTTTEETTTEETTTTSQQTPGFGIAVAMLALIGAALIALRRRS